MSFFSFLLDASFKGVPFHVQSVADNGQKALAIYEYPYRDGAEIEDMGRGPRRIPITAIFWGSSYASGVQALVAAFEERGKGELLHPVFGSVTVTVQSWNVQQSADMGESATVSFECVESVLDSSFFSGASNAAKANETVLAIQGAVEVAIAVSQGNLVGALASLQIVDAIAQSKAVQYLNLALDVYDAGREVVRSVVSYIDNPLAFVADLGNVLNVPIARITNSISGTFEDFTTLSQFYPLLPHIAGANTSTYATGRGGYATEWISGADLDKAEAQLAIALEKTPYVNSIVQESAQTLQGAVATHAAIVQTANIVTYTQDAFVQEIKSPSLTPQEIETMTGNCRARLQDCMEYARLCLEDKNVFSTTLALREMAGQVQNLGVLALNAAPPLVQYTVKKPCNFHMLAHLLYGDYSRGQELKRLNTQVRNPNFVAMGQKLYIYSK